MNLGSNRTLTFQHVYYIYLKKYLNIQKYERLSIYYILKYILKVSTCPVDGSLWPRTGCSTGGDREKDTMNPWNLANKNGDNHRDIMGM